MTDGKADKAKARGAEQARVPVREYTNPQAQRRTQGAERPRGAKAPRQRILPFFIPMEGCPRACIYCDQRRIAGAARSPLPGEISAAVAALREPHEVAFYGGSFTMLPRDRQEALLRAAQSPLTQGLRLSTRPDAIDAEEAELLRLYGVRTVELGVQSFDNEVLRFCGRDYGAEAAEKAAALLKANGIGLGVQLMPGLPLASRESDIDSARRAAALGPVCARLYPTLVIRGTKLAELYEKGEYVPLTPEEAAERCAAMAAILLDAGAKLIRVGLHDTPELRKSLTAGPFEPAFGARVYSLLALEHMRELKRLTDCRSLSAEKSYLPLLFGQNGRNRAWIKANLPEGIHGDCELPTHALAARGRLLTEQDFLREYSQKA